MGDGDHLLLAVLLGAAVVTAVGYVAGRRINRLVAVRVSRELERALEPLDSTYTWIGGLIGFHAVYRVSGLEEARATCTLLPRHSPLYLPLSMALGRADRVQITLYVRGDLHAEAHLLKQAALRSPLLRIEGRERLKQHDLSTRAGRFAILYGSEPGRESMVRLLGRLDEVGGVRHLRHLAAVPDLKTLYAQVDARPGAVEAVARLLVEEAVALASVARQASGEVIGGMQNVPETPERPLHE